MRHSLIKTRPDSEQRTGALIRAALERYDVTHRVGGGAAEHGWLATTGHTGAAVYITAHHPRQPMSYDVPTDGLIAIHAVVTTDTGTRFVYAGDPDDLHPDPAVEAGKCAEAVAAFLGLPIAEPEHQCLHCGRSIEWIEADGQGAWYDSSNWIGCVDGESLHTPAPFCGSCEANAGRPSEANLA